MGLAHKTTKNGIMEIVAWLFEELTFEYTGAEKQTAEKVRFCLLSHTKLLTSIAYKLKQLFSYFTHRMTSLSL